MGHRARPLPSIFDFVCVCFNYLQRLTIEKARTRMNSVSSIVRYSCIRSWVSSSSFFVCFVCPKSIEHYSPSAVLDLGVTVFPILHLLVCQSEIKRERKRENVKLSEA